MICDRGARTRRLPAALVAALQLCLVVLLVGACSGLPVSETGEPAPSVELAAPTQAPSGNPSGTTSDSDAEEESEEPVESDGEPAEDDDPADPASPTATGTPDVTLKVVVDPLGVDSPEAADARTTSRLSCRGKQALVGSDVPDPAAACAYALNPRGLTVTPTKGQRCTAIDGGNAVATVSGTVQGKKVTRSYSLRNGCELSQWQAAASLVGDAGDPNTVH